MVTIPIIMNQIRSEDWFVTIDLKDAYFHISILPCHRRFLRFAFGGKAYQYWVLPFGLALSPRTFTKCMDAALAPLRLQGIRQLAHTGPVSRNGSSASRCRPWPHSALGVEAQHKEERVDTRPTNYILGRGLGLNDDAGTHVSCTHRVHFDHNNQGEARPHHHSETLPQSVGPHDYSIQRDTFWPAAHESLAVVVEDQGVFPEGKSIPLDKGYAQMPSFPINM